MPNTTSVNDLKNILQPILDEVRQITSGATSTPGFYTFYKTYGAWLLPQRQAAAPSKRDETSLFPGNGISKLITSWLWDANALAAPFEVIKTSLKNSIDDQTLLWSDFTAGPGTHSPPFLRPGGNAVNPAWRKAVVRPAAEMQWRELDLNKLAERRATLQNFGSAIRAVAPQMGTYGNEADALTVDFGSAFWGANYPRLLEVKKKWDPEDVFWFVTPRYQTVQNSPLPLARIHYD